MINRNSITSRLCDIAIELESIDAKLVQLMVQKDELQRLRTKLKAELERDNGEEAMSDWRIGQQMTIDLLKEEVGHGVFGEM